MGAKQFVAIFVKRFMRIGEFLGSRTEIDMRNLLSNGRNVYNNNKSS